MKTYNQSAITTAALAVLKTADKMSEQMDTLRATLKGSDKVQGRMLLLPAVAQYYGVPTTTSESDKNKGAIVMDSDHPKYETAKKQLGRMLAALYKGTSEKAEIEVPDALVALMVRCAKSYTRAQVMAAMTGLTFKKA